MAQTARPIADTHIGSYVNEADAGTDLYLSIDESSVDDGDFIESGVAPVDDPYVCQLGPLTDPVSSTGHIVRYRYKKSGSAGIDLTVELREGYASEASPGTLIASWSHTSISTSFVTAAQTLTAGEADAITDYADLYLRFVFNQP